MTDRKPPHLDMETWIDRQIREATERGLFDNLPGAGKPLPDLHTPDDELWWVKKYLRREGLSTEALLPTGLRLRAQIERLPDTVRELPSEWAVREAVNKLNQQITQWLRAPSGPGPAKPVDPDAIVERWKADRANTTPPTATPPGDPATTNQPKTRRWWLWRQRRR